MLLKEALESVENSLFIEESIVDVVVIDTFVVASVVSEFLFSLFLSGRDLSFSSILLIKAAMDILISGSCAFPTGYFSLLGRCFSRETSHP